MLDKDTTQDVANCYWRGFANSDHSAPIMIPTGAYPQPYASVEVTTTFLHAGEKSESEDSELSLPIIIDSEENWDLLHKLLVLRHKKRGDISNQHTDVPICLGTSAGYCAMSACS
ncbi:hypothetical protein WOLCODRAFT_150252 [Wolfiporia cocos MD-104 SS10]|uniref:Uncharacterized protein n=1 Tax=Wolfiporia cocos (strain MD-104) TaxID=742152 RepID=A0A2H3JDD4_WOLCO|nr:hypothetical protein WOLCODRAFT_150252 [Wolfiporia cocos MD-104 SS10]